MIYIGTHRFGNAFATDGMLRPNDIGCRGGSIGGSLSQQLRWTSMQCWLSCFCQSGDRLCLRWHRSKDGSRGSGRTWRRRWRDICAVSLEMLGLSIVGLGFTAARRRRSRGRHVWTLEMLGLSVVRLGFTTVVFLIIHIPSVACKRVAVIWYWVLIAIELKIILVFWRSFLILVSL